MVSEYLERLCIFICTAELLGNFLPSEKFAKWYRYMVGLFVLVLMLQPLGKSVETIWDKGSGNLFAMFESERKDMQEIWEWETEYLEQLEEEQLEKYLQPYGYEEE